MKHQFIDLAMEQLQCHLVLSKVIASEKLYKYKRALNEEVTILGRLEAKDAKVLAPEGQQRAPASEHRRSTSGVTNPAQM